MPRFISLPHTIEAYRFMGSTAEMPMSFAGGVFPARAGEPCSIQCGGELRVLRPGDWIVRGESGRLDIVPHGEFEQRYEPKGNEATGGYVSGFTATFRGDPNGVPHEQPAVISWLGLVFPRGEPVPVNDPTHIDALRMNSHFVVAEPPTEPEPAAADGRTGTLTLNRKGRGHD